MIQVYFNNLENIVKTHLIQAGRSVKIAMGWLNFKIYGDIFYALLSRGVKVKIVLDDNPANRSQQALINSLAENGATIKLLNTEGTMHHKFCIIDNALCLFGSFNWTQNAENRNIEDLNICDEKWLVLKYRTEFKSLMDLNKKDFKLLRRPPICKICKRSQYTIAIIEEEGWYQTRITPLYICGCGIKEGNPSFYDISVYKNYDGILEQYGEMIDEAEQYGDERSKQILIAEMFFAAGTYLSSFRFNRMNHDIIHAVGVPGSRLCGRHDEEFFYRIIWKERGLENVICDELPREV